MSHPFQPNVRRLWILLNLTLLLVYTLIPVWRGHPDPGGLSELIELFMFMAAAPANLCLITLMDVLGLMPHYFGGVGERFALLVGFSVLGYFQWFYFAPLLLGRVRAQPLTLNLAAEATPAPGGVKSATPPGALVVGAGASGRLVLPFDERGRTPVERVFQQEADDAPGRDS